LRPAPGLGSGNGGNRPARTHAGGPGRFLIKGRANPGISEQSAETAWDSAQGRGPWRRRRGRPRI